MNGPMPCVVYAARSMADDRKDEEQSTTSQTADVLKRIEREGDRVVVGEFAESGYTGYYGERGPELDAAMEAAKAAAAEHGSAELWVFHSSRLARGDGKKGRQGLMKIWADLRYEDVQLRSVGDDEFLTNPMLVGIADTQNNKYGQDLAHHVSKGKRQAMSLGKWPGGPAPDGYRIEKTIVDNKTVSELVIDAERRPLIELIFEWSEEGVGDTTIMRRLNEAGHRTRKGKPWTRRLVQYVLTQPVYAGRILRRGEGSAKGGTWKPLDEPEVYEGRHGAIIDPDRFDRINAARRDRDLDRNGRGKATSQAERGKRGGRPTHRYLLSKLAKCERCGESMFCITSPYRRKDGSQARRYVCGNVHFSTGVCDSKPIDATKADGLVWIYLNEVFVNIEAWAAELSRGAEEQEATLRSALERQEKEAADKDRLLGKARARYRQLLDEGEDARHPERLMAELEEEIAEARERVTLAQEGLDALADEKSPTDAALDFYLDLAAGIEGAKNESVQALNEKLKQEFTAIFLNAGTDDEDGPYVSIHPVLRERRGVADRYVEGKAPPVFDMSSIDGLAENLQE